MLEPGSSSSTKPFVTSTELSRNTVLNPEERRVVLELEPHCSTSRTAWSKDLLGKHDPTKLTKLQYKYHSHHEPSETEFFNLAQSLRKVENQKSGDLRFPEIEDCHKLPFTANSSQRLYGKSYIDWFKELMLFYNQTDIRRLPLHQRSNELNKRFNATTGANINVYINFEGCTSYNIPGSDTVKRYEISPANAYNLRPDLTRGPTYDEDVKYANFLERRRQYLVGRGSEAPEGTTIYIRNIPSRYVRQKTLFRVFSPYGDIRNLFTKESYGLIQYSSATEAMRALRAEHQVPIFGNKWQVEPSATPFRKPTQLIKLNEDEYLRAKMLPTTEPTPQFSQAAFKKILKWGVRWVVSAKQPYSKIDQSHVKNAAFEGFHMVVVIRNQALDVTFFKTDQMGKLRYDEYSHISIKNCVELIKEYRRSKGLPEVPTKRPDPKPSPNGATFKIRNSLKICASPDVGSTSVVHQFSATRNVSIQHQHQKTLHATRMQVEPYPQFKINAPKICRDSETSCTSFANINPDQPSQTLQTLDPDPLKSLITFLPQHTIVVSSPQPYTLLQMPKPVFPSLQHNRQLQPPGYSSEPSSSS